VELILHLLNKCVSIAIITNFKAQPSRSVLYQSEMLKPSSLGYLSSTSFGVLLCGSILTRPKCSCLTKYFHLWPAHFLRL